MKNATNQKLFLQQFAPWVVLVILLAYSYARFFVAPYPGFVISPEGEVDTVYVVGEPGGEIHLGDRIVQIGAVSWKNYLADVRKVFFEDAKPGDVVSVIVERNGRQQEVLWQLTGPSISQVLDRLGSQWWLGFAFWFFGTLAFFFFRPKDRFWQLLIASNYLTSIWLIAGSISYWAIWHSAVVMRMAIWLCLPVYLHLHWIFLTPLKKFPHRLGQIIYLFAVLMAVAEWFQLLPPPTYFLGFLTTFVGSLGLLVAHAIYQPNERRTIGLLTVLIGAGVLPSLVAVLVFALGNVERVYVITMFGLPVIPLAYLYVAYRHRLGKWELRANRAITFILYAMLLVTISIFVLVILTIWLLPSSDPLTVGIIFIVLIGLGTARYYAGFQRWVENSLLKIPLQTSQLVNVYAERITTSLEMARLTGLLEKEILPSLLIRQSALLLRGANQEFRVLYMSGISEAELPPANAPFLLSQVGQFRPAIDFEEKTHPWPWVRLVLNLRLGSQVIGLWLFGRRDPDDFYAQSEIEILQSLANQTAIALSNILQAEHLQSLYRANVGRDEAERSRLALELHDDVLGQMALLAMSTDEHSQNAAFGQAYKAATNHVREVINTLRPAMLNYGLRAALDELTDNALDLAGEDVRIQMDVEQSTQRYPLEVESYVYRIIQQACQNAIQHAQPTLIRIFGQFQDERIDLTVEDNGVGFSAGESFDLVGLLAEKHFGLAGMYERAAVIGAQLLVDSAPQEGTRVRVIWENKNP
jgi:signal transduction histidine kinase